MPASLIEHEDSVGSLIDGQADLLEMLGHALRGAPGQDKARTLSVGRADRPEDVGRLGALVVCCARTCSAFRSAPGDRIPLPYPGFEVTPAKWSVL